MKRAILSFVVVVFLSTACVSLAGANCGTCGVTGEKTAQVETGAAKSCGFWNSLAKVFRGKGKGSCASSTSTCAVPDGAAPAAGK